MGMWTYRASGLRGIDTAQDTLMTVAKVIIEDNILGIQVKTS